MGEEKNRIGGCSSMAAKLREIIETMNQFASPDLAEGWDRIGLFLGDPEQEIKKIHLALGISCSVMQEAIQDQADLIITHHPLWLQAPSYFSEDTFFGKIVTEAIRNRVAVFSAHTNLDACKDGVNDTLASLLGLEKIETLESAAKEWLKLAVFVPESHLEKVRDAISEAGAGKMGLYSHCSFAAPGIGTFLPLQGAHPAIGKVGEVEKVAEAKLEVILSSDQKEQVLKAMIESHPYEEIAYDLYLLANQISSEESLGLGRIGELKKEMTLEKFLEYVKTKLEISHLRFCGNPSHKIKKIAVCGGSGMSLWQEAKCKGAEVFLTGDIKHHDAEDALAAGLSLVDAGHYSSEKCILPVLKNILETKLSLKVQLSKSEKEVFQFR